MLTARMTASPRQAFGDDSGFDYFTTDFHYQNVAAEIRRQLARRQGFVLVSGPPAPDGKLIARYLDGSSLADHREAPRERATLVRCRQGWTFGDVVIACGRELGLSPDAGVFRIWSQVMKDSRWGVTRILVIDNAEVLDDDSFDELHRFTKLDDPKVLPVVLLVAPGFAARLEARLQVLRPAIIALLPLQQLAAVEVPAFIRHQLEPLGADDELFTPETMSVITETAQGDPRMVNRLARQSLELFVSRRAPPPPPAPAPAPAPLELADTVMLPPGVVEVARMVSPAARPAVEPEILAPPPLPAMVPSARAAPARGRFARGMTAAVGFLVVEVVAIALLGFYALAPHHWAQGSATEAALGPPHPVAAIPTAAYHPPAPVAAPPAVAPAQLRSPPAPPAVPGNTIVARAEPVPVPALKLPPPAAVAAPPAAVAALPAAVAAPSAAVAALPPPAPPLALPPPLAEAAAPPPAPLAAAPVTRPLDAAARQAAAIEPSAPPARVALLAPAPTSRPAPPSGASRLVERGDRLLAEGDIASARQFFERAVETGDVVASCSLGKSYDPLFLEEQSALRGVVPDPAKAAAWYRHAVQAGSAEAKGRLAQLLARYPTADQADQPNQ